MWSSKQSYFFCSKLKRGGLDPDEASANVDVGGGFESQSPLYIRNNELMWWYVFIFTTPLYFFSTPFF